jgi:hypothetical protein
MWLLVDFLTQERIGVIETRNEAQNHTQSVP